LRATPAALPGGRPPQAPGSRRAAATGAASPVARPGECNAARGAAIEFPV